MADQPIISALILGLIEGLTEFIPVSSTAHVLLAGHFLGFKSPGNTFAVLIQLGAILAILLVYFKKLVSIAVTLPTSAASRHFVVAVLIGFLPAAVIGAIAHDFIKTVLFETPALICVVLIVGGIILLVVDKVAIVTPGKSARDQGVMLLAVERSRLAATYTDVQSYPYSLAFKIGLCQCLAMIPGTSRSGSTIVGALLLGADKRSAAEFSFFLAMPTMAGAFTLDLYKNRHLLSFDDGIVIGLGFIAAFVSALLVVRSLLDFVSRRGYAPFAWWRIAVGTLGLIGLYAIG